MKNHLVHLLSLLLVGLVLCSGCAEVVPDSSGEKTTTTVTTTSTTTESSAPEKTTAVVIGGNKQQLRIVLNGESILMTFSEAEEKSGYSDLVWWNYNGTAQDGSAASCAVVNNRIVSAYIHFPPSRFSNMGKEQTEVEDFVNKELTSLGFDCAAAITRAMIMFHEEDGHHYAQVTTTLSVGETVCCTVRKLTNGQYVLISLSTWHKDGEKKLPGLDATEVNYLIPNWC